MNSDEEKSCVASKLGLQSACCVSDASTLAAGSSRTREHAYSRLASDARIEAGHRLDLVREPMDVIALTQRVIAEFLQSREQQHIQIFTPGTETIGNWDPRQLERVSRNLLNNVVNTLPTAAN